MTDSELTATIFGARGSLPNLVRGTAKYGGASTCFFVRTPDKIPIIIDAGSGIYDLGQMLVRDPQVRPEVHLFLTHTHWDHVQGLVLFLPLYTPWQTHIHVLGMRRDSLEDLLSFAIERGATNLHFHELGFDDTIQIENTMVRCVQANHPGYALGFRVEHADRSLFFASDTAPFTDVLFGDEFHKREKTTDPSALAEMQQLQMKFDHAVGGVDLLLHDANYTDEEYEQVFHFGHASITHAYELAKRCGVKHVVFWHHDRSRLDEQVDAITAEYVSRGAQDGITVEPAQQGKSYHLPLGTQDIRVSVLRD